MPKTCDIVTPFSHLLLMMGDRKLVNSGTVENKENEEMMCGPEKKDMVCIPVKDLYMPWLQNWNT